MCLLEWFTVFYQVMSFAFTLSHTPTLSLTHTLSLTLTLSHSLPHTPSHSLFFASHKHSLSHTHSLSLTHTWTILSLSLSHYFSHIPARFSHSFSQFIPHTYLHNLIMFVCVFKNDSLKSDAFSWMIYYILPGDEFPIHSPSLITFPAHTGTLSL